MTIIISELLAGGAAGPERALEQTVIRIGRDAAGCDIAFDTELYPMVSRRHAELRYDAGRWFVVDLDSSFGTFLDGTRTTGSTRVSGGSTIQFGQGGPQIRIEWVEVLADSLPPVVEPEPVPKMPEPSPSPPAALPVPTSPYRTAADAAVVLMDDPDPQHVKIGDLVTIGRDPSCEVAFGADKVMTSRKHATIRRDGGRLVLADNGSFNGTFINEERISGPADVHHGDVLRFGIGGPRVRIDAPAFAPAASAEKDSDRSKTMVARLDQISAPAASSSEPRLMVSLRFDGRKELTIGRDPSCDIVLDGLQISSRHARLLHQGSDVVIDDLNSTNGVFLNGARVSRAQFSPQDRVQIGSFEIRIDSQQNIGVFDTRSKTRIDAVGISRQVRVKSGRLKVLDDVSITIQPNEFVGIIGPSGAGKSTLLNALNGISRPDAGSVLINGRDLYADLASLKQSIGFVPQDDIIHRELTVYRTLYYVARLRLSRDVSKAEIERTISEILDVTGLAERRNVPVSSLSGGQRKRVSIAVELITKPSIIYLDEPTSGLDPATEDRIMRLFRVIAESGRTVVLTTHAMENVRLFDKIAVLMSGKLVFFGPPAEALKHLEASGFKALFDRLEAPVESAVATRGESVRGEANQNAAEAWRQKFIASRYHKELIAAPQSGLASAAQPGTAKTTRLGVAGSVRQWMTLSRRYFEVLLKDKANLFILLAQAPLIAILTAAVVGAEKPRDFSYFILAIVAVWFGTSVAARELVRERPVFKRERMVNLGLLPYLASKLTVLGLIVAVQCLLLFLPLKLFGLLALSPLPGEAAGLPQLWAMLLTAGVGIATGLLISSLVKTSQTATSLVPLVLIPQILLSGIVGVPTGVSKPASLLVPAAWSFDTMKRFSTLDTLEPDGKDPGLYRRIEADNDKALAETRKELESYQSDLEKKLKQFDDARSLGLTPTLEKPAELPAVPAPKKLPSDLSGYITFLHPWMNEVLNQIVLMLMFGFLALATLIVLKARDGR